MFLFVETDHMTTIGAQRTTNLPATINCAYKVHHKSQHPPPCQNTACTQTDTTGQRTMLSATSCRTSGQRSGGATYWSIILATMKTASEAEMKARHATRRFQWLHASSMLNSTPPMGAPNADCNNQCAKLQLH